MIDPLITVLLPVYNGANDVAASVRCVLEQTYDDFELLIIDDGSTDNSRSILESFNDPRISLFTQTNHGLAATLNRGISLARGKYIARQDQDDISFPRRLEQQLAFMESNPDVALLGTRAEIWVGDQPSDRAHDHPIEHHELCFDLLFNNPFVHSSVMIRRSAVQELEGYSTDKMRQPPEDFELWSRMARKYKVANLPERLLAYREVPQSMSRTGPNPFLDRLVTICAENLAFANGLEAPNPVCNDFAALTHSAFHRLSKRPDIEQMCVAIRSAAKSIDQENEGHLLADRVAARINTLRYQYMMQRTNTSWARPLARRARSLLSRFGLRKSL